ncbi:MULTISPECIES: putative glycoside hydrolase [Carnobacterium]|uniref:Glycoside hydrolase n=1 Tax=Carnobacterium antarcticum TaxID=2126436 RepID=A0ABW4NQZ8_9LACT|nr:MULTISPECIES: putative glycoside hydrolase [unclassified Carnobacterium]ALV21221.1 putative glycoside hydrolase [Carnobacterium sp. CP1]QQP71351.1 putative glycoside hydrolase [Carnobacterium sp. CS13]
MKNNKKWIGTLLLSAAFFLSMPFAVQAEETEQKEPIAINDQPLLSIPEKFPAQFAYDSGIDIPYPEKGVKGIYVTAYSAGGTDKMAELTDFVKSSGLNSMVIDVKDDEGSMTMDIGSENEIVQQSTQDYVTDPQAMLKQLEKDEIYPIGRIVVFKDTLLAEARPDLSFKRADGSVWKNSNGDAFVNPFSKEVWDYNVEVAKQAAKMGFKEIQFDYVRFPEGFETQSDSLDYTHGDYDTKNLDEVQQRVEAVTDFVKYAREELKPYGVEVSVDIFGYAATVPEAPGIGQNFSKISENVDVISSMIYPSHWGSYFGIGKPDLEPYKLVSEYMKVENELLGGLDTPPQSRPWLQDFTASYLGAGNYMNYGAPQVEDQVKALHEAGVDEFLLWDANNTYTPGVNYNFN